MVLAGFRGRLRLRQRFRDPVAIKHDAQLRWWLEEWERVIQAGGLNPADALEYLPGETIQGSYLGRRRQLARSQLRRVMAEAAIDDERFFAGQVVVEVGPGPLGFPDACPARISIGVDPLAERYAAHGLLLPDSPAVYLTARAERLPLLSASADVALARDTLDYVEDPEQALAELDRVLRPGGTLIVLFDVDHRPTLSQPNALTIARVRGGLGRGWRVVHQHEWDEPFGDDGHRVVLRMEKATPAP